MILRAKEGYIYTDGETYGTTILLEEGKSDYKFYQIKIEEYEKRLMESLEG